MYKIVTKDSNPNGFPLGHLILSEANARPTIHNDAFNTGNEPYWYKDVGFLDRMRGLGRRNERNNIEPILQIALDNKIYFQQSVLYITDDDTLYFHGEIKTLREEEACYEDTSDYELLRNWYKYNYNIDVSPKIMTEIVKILVKYEIIPTKERKIFDAEVVMSILVNN